MTCQAQPALGAVYKIVELDHKPCMKVLYKTATLSSHTTIHTRTHTQLVSPSPTLPSLDLSTSLSRPLDLSTSLSTSLSFSVLCLCPVQLSAEVSKVSIPGRKAVYRLHGRDGAPICDVLLREDEDAPQENEPFLCRHPFQEQKRAHVRPRKVTPLLLPFWDGGEVKQDLPTIHELKAHVTEQVAMLRTDHKRRLNPTPYKVSVSETLFQFLHDLWMEHAPIGELS